MTFEFTFGNNEYKYDDGKIYRKYSAKHNFYDYFCSVLNEFNDIADKLSTEQLSAILKAIIHSHDCGVIHGKTEKIKEFKRVFNLD